MGGSIETLKVLVAKLDELRAERKGIDDRIAALELAVETFGGDPAPKRDAEASPTRRRARSKSGRRVDRRGIEKVKEFLKDRGKVTSLSQVANRFGISHHTASNRLLTLIKRGGARRVEKGRYEYSNGVVS